MKPFFASSDTAAAQVRQASDIGGLPANIENNITTVTDDIKPSRLQVLQKTLNQPQDVFSVIGNYAADINDMVALADQVDQGVSDATLASDVQAYNALALAKEQASEQRGLLNSAFASPTVVNVGTYQIGPGPAYTIGTGPKVTGPSVDTMDPDTEAALANAYGQEFIDEHAFYQAATPAEAMHFTDQLGPLAVGIALGLEQNMFSNVNSDYFVDGGAADTGVNIAGSQLVPNVQTLVYPPSRRQASPPTGKQRRAGIPARHQSQHPEAEPECPGPDAGPGRLGHRHRRRAQRHAEHRDADRG